ncbi:hypothetical protein [Streptomyces sp. NPDC051561]|uniref:hypothetical protein n=1 Tax=Streptomyces sp. NPDC051561 TaxID=3365658 RepID=UPI0037A8BBA8
MGGDAYALFQRLGREGRGPVAASAKAAGDLKGQGFALGGGLHRVQERWGQQVRSLVDACAHVAQRMDFTGKVHREDELAVHRVVSSIARLETAFEERSERRGGGGGPGGGGPGGHGPARGKPEGGR